MRQRNKNVVRGVVRAPIAVGCIPTALACLMVSGLAAPTWATPRQASLIVGFPRPLNGLLLSHDESIGFTVSPSGAVAFGGRLHDAQFNVNNIGIWAAAPGQLTTIGLAGTPITGGVPPRFNTSEDTPMAQSAGAAYFSARTVAADGFTLSHGIWRGTGASATPVFTNGQTVPGLPAGVTINTDPNGLNYFIIDALSSDGALYATVPLSGPGIGSGQTAMCVSDAGGSRVLLRNGAVIPGTSAVASNAQIVRASTGGRLLMNISSPDGNNNTFGAVWSYDGAAWTPQVATGTPVPGIPGSTLYSPQAQASSAAGGVLFRGSIGFPVFQGHQDGLWRREADGTTTFLARNNAPVPGLPGWVTNSDAPTGMAMNDNGASVYMARMTNNPNPYLWTMVVTTPTSTNIVLREGQFLPNGMRSPLGSSTSTTEMNAFGQFAFQLDVSPTGGGSLSPGVYGYSPDVGIFSVASPGDVMQIDGGPARTVVAAELAREVSTNNMTRSGLLGNGNVVVYVGFSDGTQAIVTTPMPAPGAAVTLALAGLVAARRRRG